MNKIDKTPGVRTSKTVITSETAHKLLEGMKRNRPVRQSHVDKLARAMLSGEWRLDGDAVIISKSGNVIEGQHRLWACFNSGASFETVLVEGVEDDAFLSLGDKLSRSGPDQLGYLGVPDPRIVVPALTVLWFYINHDIPLIQGGKIAPSKKELFALFEDHKGIVDYSSAAHRLRNIIAPSVACFFMYVFGAIDRALSESFFEQLEYGVGKNETMPVFHLRKRLLSDREQKAKLPRIEKFALIIKAWNMHIRNTPCSLLRWQSTESFPQIRKVA